MSMFRREWAMKKAAIHNLGCKVNSYESESMQQMLQEAGYEIVSFNEQADVYVINTCTVTQIADQKSRQMISRAKKLNNDAIVVAAGCYVQGDSEALKKCGADILIGNNLKSHLIEMIDKYNLKRHQMVDVKDISQARQYENMHLYDTKEHSRAFIKVQDGCNAFCTYCKIPYVRGRARSRAVEDIIDELKVVSQKGHREIVLTGIHLSSFGKDMDSSLIELIERANEIEQIERIRLGSLEPMIIDREFSKRLKKCEKICPHFHLSLQSGCDATLKRMNRHYTTEEYKMALDILRSTFEHPAITTDVIVGFPGETDEEFEKTRSYLEQINLYQMHIFKFSRRKGTKAYDFANQVDNNTKKARSSILQDISDNNTKEFKKYYIDRDVEMFPEEEITYRNKKYIKGYTKEYIMSIAPSEYVIGKHALIRKAKSINEQGYLVLE